jgi:hypothetical protein
MTISSLNYHATALPAAQSLENSIAVAVNNSRLQGLHHDITKAQTDNSFERTKELIKGIEYGTIKSV